MKMKKLLATTLAVAMVMATALPVCAKTTTVTGGSGSSTPISAEQVKVEAATVKPGAMVTVGGKTVQNTIQNVDFAESVQGTVVATPKDTVKANLGLKAGQEPKLLIYDMDAKKSPAAMACLEAGAQSVNGKIVAALDIDLSAVEKGKKVTLSDGSVAMAMGLPKEADTTKTYVMVCVQPGGKTTILEDQDTNPKTITFAVQAGLGAYALVAK